ncbi:MAG TPA: hypothetical protein DCZ10_17860, partial [Pelotomaculum sp.]|nr:hypothetical protein [Pelotomaculum sp.]
VNFFANWIMLHRYQQKLLSVKKKNAWVYQRKKVVTVDLNVAKEKGKSCVSAFWTWWFLFLSFIPAVFLLISPKTKLLYPVMFSLIGPLCQLGLIYVYYQMRNRHAPALSDNTEINKACARTEERVNTLTATLSSFSMLVFWILINVFIIYLKSGLLAIVSAVILVIALNMIANWQQKKIRAVENSFFGELTESNDSVYEKEGTWKWGCYYNPGDPRVFVSKRIASMGWTINIGRPVGKLIGCGILAFLFIIIGTIFYGGAKDYQITINGSEIMIDAAMYDMTLEKNQVVSVSIMSHIPGGFRTNGYSGVNKSYGHFSIDGYGKCMLYVYNKVDQYIVLRLEGDAPGYVIVNDKSKGEMERLYEAIRQWIAE